MDEFLTPVKTVRNVKSNIEKFEILSLRDKQTKHDVASTRKIVSEVSNGRDNSSNILRKSELRDQSVDENDHAKKDLICVDDQTGKSAAKSIRDSAGPISSPEHAFSMLKQQLAEDELQAVIRYFENGIRRKHNFNLHVPSAMAAQILNVLVTSVIPDRWVVLSSTTASKTEKEIRKSLLLCMSSTAGIGALIARIQSLLTSPLVRKHGSSQQAVFNDTVSLFTSMAYHATFVRDLLARNQSSGSNTVQQQAVWAEATSLFAGSKILNIFQEASTISELKADVPSWLQDARNYSGWLGVNIASAAISIAPSMEDSWKMLANFLKRALSLGHKGWSA